MSIDVIETLSESYLGNERWLRASYTGHGDLALDFGQGNPETPHIITKAVMAHSADVKLFAGLVGYCRRLDMPQKEIADTFNESLTGIFRPAVPEDTMFARHLEYILDGEDIRPFSHPGLGWSCLIDPIPVHPGVASKKGGTGVYTRTDVFGSHNLLLTQIEPQWSNSDESTEKPLAELCPQDILPAARLLGRISAGQYRSTIFHIVDKL